MALIAVTPVDFTTGLGPTMVAATNGDTVKCAPNVIFEVANGSGSSITFDTITSPGARPANGVVPVSIL